MVRCVDCRWRRHPAFKTVDHETLMQIQSMKRAHQRLAAGTELIHPGEDVDVLYTVYAGWICRYKEIEDGRRQLVGISLPGDLVGMQAAMFDAASYGAFALTDVEVCVLPRRRVWELFGDWPELAFDVTWLCAREERFLDEHLTTVGQRTAVERVAALICGLHDRLAVLGLVDADGGFAFPLRQQHIADALGLSLVHTNKTLARLRRLNVLGVSGGRVVVADAEQLRALAKVAEEERVPRPLI
jgi:cAMP-binding proteins - catabolite gene activator and regulatory subunit of cAMP-dependent protein kinases